MDAGTQRDVYLRVNPRSRAAIQPQVPAGTWAKESFMWTILILFVLWILSIEFYLPIPVVLILFSALFSGATVTISFALARRRAAAAAAAATIAERDTTGEFLKKAG